MEQLHYLAKGHAEGGGDVAVTALGGGDYLVGIKVTTVLAPRQGGNHLLHKVVDVEELELHGGVTDLDGEVVGDVVAEGCHGRVIVGATPFAKQVGEAVDQHPRSGRSLVVKEELLAGALALAIGVAGIAPQERGLD